MFRKKVIIAVAAFVLIAVLVGQSLSAGGVRSGRTGGQRPQRGAERPPRGADQRQMMQRNPQEMQERMQTMMIERMKRQLQIEDDKWVTVKPLLENVMKLNGQLNPSARGGMFGGFGGAGAMGMGGRGGMSAGGRGGAGAGAGGRGGQGQTRPGATTGTAKAEKTGLQKAVEDLQGLLRSQDAKDDDITAKVTAVRAAKTKLKADLAKAQDALKAQMNVKQEANLVIMGLLN